MDSFNAVELSRHSGMDRRNPDCMEASKPDHPWSLGSGAPCRNDAENLNSTTLMDSLPPHNRIDNKMTHNPLQETSSQSTPRLFAGIDVGSEGLVLLVRKNGKPLDPQKYADISPKWASCLCKAIARSCVNCCTQHNMATRLSFINKTHFEQCVDALFARNAG